MARVEKKMSDTYLHCQPSTSQGCSMLSRPRRLSPTMMHRSLMDDRNLRARASLLGLTPPETFGEMNQSYPRLQILRHGSEPTGAFWRRKNLQTLSERALNATCSYASGTLSSCFSRLSLGYADSESLLVRNPNKSVLTVDGKTQKVLTCNDMACRMFALPESKIIDRKLSDLFGDFSRLKNRPDILDETLTDMHGNIKLRPVQGKVMEIVDSTGMCVPVALWLDRFVVGTPPSERWLLTFEPVEKTGGACVLDSKSHICTCDDTFAQIFGYTEAKEVDGVMITALIPALRLDATHETWVKHYLTGKSIHDFSFPLSVKVRRLPSKDISHEIIVDVYATISGLITITDTGQIHSCNQQFMSFMFGYSHADIIGKDISLLIPDFLSNSSLSMFSPFIESPCEQCCRGPEASLEQPVRSYTPPLVVQLRQMALADSGSVSDLSNSCSQENDNFTGSVGSGQKRPKASSLQDFPADPVSPPSGNKNCFYVNGAEPSANGHCSQEPLTSTPRQRARDSMHSELSSPAAFLEGSFWGRGCHKDGSLFGIGYDVRHVNKSSLYCVYVVRDPDDASLSHYSYSLSWTPMTKSMLSEQQQYEANQTKHLRGKSGSLVQSTVTSDYLTGVYSEKYHALQHVGKGGFGCVKLAARKTDSLLVITKFVDKRHVLTECWVEDPIRNKRLPIEVYLLTTLSHPNIVKVLEILENDNWYQIVMEKHGSGMDLFEFIDRQPNVDEKLASYMFRQLSSAVAYLHRNGVVHRDIKDENVIIDHHFTCLLIDFGSAAYLEPKKLFSTFCGTSEYCSPEVLLGNRYAGPELEIWSLGVLLYTLLFHENPFYDAEEAIRAELRIQYDISDGLFHLLSWMLHPLPHERAMITDVESHWWICQPVDVTRYRFDRVLLTTDPAELDPPMYLTDLQNDLLSPESHDPDYAHHSA